MQEEVENRSVTLAISTAKLTARALKAAITKYLAYLKAKQREKSRDSPVTPHGEYVGRILHPAAAVFYSCGGEI